MADPIKLQILKALTSHLEGVLAPDNTPLTGKVFRGRTQFGEGDPVNMLSMLEAPRPDTGVSAGEYDSHRKYDWIILLQGWCADDKLNPTDNAYVFMDAVETHLGRVIATNAMMGTPKYPAEFMLGNLITSFAFGPGVVRPPDANSSRAYFYIPLKLGMTAVVV